MAASLLLATADDWQRYILFAVFLLIFCATAIITLLGIIGKVKIRDGYLKALFSALILEVIGVIIAVAKSTLSPAPPPPLPDDYQVWTVMGKMDMSHSHLSASGIPPVAIEVLPQPAMDSNGMFNFYVAAPRKNGGYALPTVRFIDREANQLREIPLDSSWDKLSEIKVDRDVTRHIATIGSFLLTPINPSAYTEGAVKDASEHRSSIPLKMVTASETTKPSTPNPEQSP